MKRSRTISIGSMSKRFTRNRCYSYLNFCPRRYRIRIPVVPNQRRTLYRVGISCSNAEMPKCRNAHTWPTDVHRVSLPTNQLDFDLIGLSKSFRLHFRPSTHFHHSRLLRFFHLTVELRYTRYFINYVSYELRRVSYGYRRSSRITVTFVRV